MMLWEAGRGCGMDMEQMDMGEAWAYVGHVGVLAAGVTASGWRGCVESMWAG